MKLNYKLSATTSMAAILFFSVFCFSAFAEPEIGQYRLYKRIAEDAAIIKKLSGENKAILNAYKAFQNKLMQLCKSGGTITAVGANNKPSLFYCSKAVES